METRMMHLIQTFKGDRKGFSLVEYALLAGLVALASVAILSSMGISLTSLFTGVNSHLSSA
jgi:pilus assembly protein Flp/PilA